MGPAPIALGLVLVSFVMAAGCADSEPGTDSLAATTTSSTGSTSTSAGVTSTVAAPSPAATSTTASSGTATSELSSSEKNLGNGRVRAGGFIKRAYEEGGGRKIDIDYADFLTGEEAERAAADAGDEVNNDYYIRNVNPKVRTFSVSAASFELPEGDPSSPQIGDWDDFSAYTAERPFVFFWIERVGTDVVLIEGQWVP
jgi:hypothetical protein